jgi:chromosome segregation ATPase
MSIFMSIREVFLSNLLDRAAHDFFVDEIMSYEQEHQRMLGVIRDEGEKNSSLEETIMLMVEEIGELEGELCVLAEETHNLERGRANLSDTAGDLREEINDLQSTLDDGEAHAQKLETGVCTLQEELHQARLQIAKERRVHREEIQEIHHNFIRTMDEKRSRGFELEAQNSRLIAALAARDKTIRIMKTEIW